MGLVLAAADDRAVVGMPHARRLRLAERATGFNDVRCHPQRVSGSLCLNTEIGAGVAVWRALVGGGHAVRAPAELYWPAARPRPRA